jgi:hypothetical protein
MHGNMNNVRMVEEIKPPVTTIAIGFCISAPVPPANKRLKLAARVGIVP